MANSSFHGSISQRAIDYVDKIRSKTEANVVLQMFGAWCCRTYLGEYEPIKPVTYFDHFVAYRSAVAAFQDIHVANDLWLRCASAQHVVKIEQAFERLVHQTPQEMRVLAYRYLWFVIANCDASIEPQDLDYHLAIFNFAFADGGIERLQTDPIYTTSESLVDFDLFVMNYW